MSRAAPGMKVGRATRVSNLTEESVGLIGGGAFATALASLISTTQRTAVVFADDERVRKDINRNHQNQSRLPGVSLSKLVTATGDLAELTSLCRLIVLAVPAHRAVATLHHLGEHITGEHIIAHSIGCLADGERRISQEIAAHTPATKVAALAGPALPDDLTARRSCAMVVASESDEVASEVKRILHAPPTMRIYKSRDVLGVELASALSGAITVAVGLADGLGVGNGPRTVLLTRAINEAARIGVANGAAERTFFGMAGLGNLLVRCSTDSRKSSVDYQLGHALAQTRATIDWSTPGTRTLATAARVARLLGIDAPILTMVHKVVEGELPLDVAVDRLASWETDLE